MRNVIILLISNYVLLLFFAHTRSIRTSHVLATDNRIRTL